MPCSLAPEVLTEEMFSRVESSSVETLAGKSTTQRCARHFMPRPFLTVSVDIPLWIHRLRYRHTYFTLRNGRKVTEGTPQAIERQQTRIRSDAQALHFQCFPSIGLEG